MPTYEQTLAEAAADLEPYYATPHDASYAAKSLPRLMALSRMVNSPGFCLPSLGTVQHAVSILEKLAAGEPAFTWP